MLFRKRTSTSDMTVASLRKTVERSFVAKVRIRFVTLLGRTRRFFQDYRMPAMATVAFVVILLLFAIVRQFEQTSLISLRNQLSAAGNGYSLLLRQDEADKFTRNDTSEDSGDTSSPVTNSPSSTQSTSNSFTVVTNPGGSNSTSGGSSGGSGSSGSGNNGGSNGGGTSEPQPFAATIDTFAQGSVSLQCANPSKPNKGSCAKVYAFNANVRTVNGPGTVTYTWISSSEAGNSNGSFTVVEASASTALSREISLPCNRPQSFTAQFSVNEPVAVSSTALSINHNCNEL